MIKKACTNPACGYLNNENDIICTSCGKAFSDGSKTGLIDCPDCNGKISLTACTCPHCGKPLATTPETATLNKIFMFMAIMVVLNIIAAIYLNFKLDEALISIFAY